MLFGRWIRKSKTIVVTKSPSGNERHITYLQHPQTKIVTVVYFFVPIRFTVERTYIRKKIKCALWIIGLYTRNLFQKLINYFPALAVLIHHFFCRCQVARDGGQRTPLRDGTIGKSDLPFHFVASVSTPFWCSDVSYAPARHAKT